MPLPTAAGAAYGRRGGGRREGRGGGTGAPGPAPALAPDLGPVPCPLASRYGPARCPNGQSVVIRMQGVWEGGGEKEGMMGGWAVRRGGGGGGRGLRETVSLSLYVAVVSRLCFRCLGTSRCRTRRCRIAGTGHCCAAPRLVEPD